jgi:hypothetical protein
MGWTFYNASGQKLNTAATSIDVLDIDGATAIGEAVVGADLFIMDNGPGGTNVKVTATEVATFIGSAFTFEGNDTSESSVTAYTADDATSVAGISIAAAAPIDVTFIGRRDVSGAAARPVAGFKITTSAGAVTVQEAALANGVNSYYDFQNSDLAADGGGMILLLPRITNYQQGIIAHQFNSGAATGENSSGGQSIKPVIDALMPIGTITSLTMRVLNINTAGDDPDPQMDHMFVWSRAIA